MISLEYYLLNCGNIHTYPNYYKEGIIHTIFNFLYFNQATTTEPISMKLCKKVSYIPESNTDHFSF